MPIRGVLTAILSTALCASAQSSEPQKAVLDKDAYVTVSKDGHLMLNGRRIRFWGCTGGFTLLRGSEGRNPYADMDLIANRLKELGFNMVRCDDRSNRGSYTKGDSSSADITDYFFFKIKQLGFKVWNTALNDKGSATPEDVDIIKDSATAAAWKAAVTEWSSQDREGRAGRKGRNGRPSVSLGKNVAVSWDARFQAIAIRSMKETVEHVNQYTGLRVADDPLYAVWELSNEDGFISRMVNGEWQRFPKFFQDGLFAKWHEFLNEKYATEDSLKKAWKFLLPGESFKDRTILLAPIRSSTAPVVISDANPEAVAVLQASKQKYSREDFMPQRGADVLEFFTELYISMKRREADAVRPLGKSISKGVLLWNTGFPGSSIQCQFLHQNAGAVSHDSYIGGTHHDPTHRRYPFYSGLEELPRMAWKEPWLEQNRHPTMPFLVYETQIDNTSKYRAEFPMRQASLGSIQDWDAIVWHYYGFPTDAREEKPFVRKLDVGHSLNLHFQFDEIQLSAMKAASEIFRNFHLKTAPSPTLFVFGKKALYDPASMNPEDSYFGLLDRMTATTYRYGMRLLIDPTLENRPKDPLFKSERDYHRFLEDGYLIVGPSYRPRSYEPNPIRPNDQIEYDWQKGHLLFDAPGVAGYTGFLAQYGPSVVFKNGTALKDVIIVNPDGMPYPVHENEKFVSFALVSTDGKPLTSCKRAMISLMCTSFNSGFRLDTTKMVEFFAPKVIQGELPVLVARVGAIIENPSLQGMKYRFVDWNQKEIGSGTVVEGALRIPADKAVFYVELSR